MISDEFRNSAYHKKASNNLATRFFELADSFVAAYKHETDVPLEKILDEHPAVVRGAARLAAMQAIVDEEERAEAVSKAETHHKSAKQAPA